MTNGIDVSHYQRVTDWHQVAAAGIEFVMVKATEGTGYRDPACAGHVGGAAAAGLLCGLYHYAHPAATLASAEAANLCRAWDLNPGAHTLPVGLDLEQAHRYSPVATVRWCVDWLQRVEAHTGTRPIIYTSASWCEALGNAVDELAPWPLWVAHYTTKPAPALPRAWDRWLWWQHTSKGRVAGIPGYVDLNRSSLDRAALAALTHHQEDDMLPDERLLLIATAERVHDLHQKLMPDSALVDDAELLQAVASLKESMKVDGTGRG